MILSLQLVLEMYSMDFLKRAWVEINLNALKHNYNTVCKMSGVKVIPVVKANAYGHGAPSVATALQECGADMFAVSNVVEGIELRDAGINGDILILGYTPVDAFDLLIEHNIIQCVYSLEYAEALSAQAVKQNTTLKVHLKIDSGMGRIGFDCRKNDCDISEILKALALDGLKFTGVFTHFSVSDSRDEDNVKFSRDQYDRFNRVVSQLEKHGFSFPLKHCSNSAAIVSYSDMCLDAVRAGIVLYGLAPSDEVSAKSFLPVMSMYSTISMVKNVESGDSVSYGRTYIADKKRKIATVSAGYADGVPRLLSNNGYVLINGKKAPIVGRVCMDQFCVDVSDIDDVKMGDVAEIFGDNISVDVIADISKTINYEIICGINKRVPRLYKN